MGVIRRSNGNRAVLIGLAFLAVALMGSLIYPIASALLFAAVLAGALYPWFQAVSARLGGRAMVASGLLTVAVALLLVVPAVWLAFAVGSEVMTGVASIERTFKRGGVPALIERLPPSLRQHVRTTVAHVPGGAEQIQDLAKDQAASNAAPAVTAAIVATSTIAVQVALMLVALFFFLMDGQRLVQWFAKVAPLPASEILAILSDFRSVSVAVLLSTLGTSGIQTVAAVAGYVVAGVPHVLLFGFVTFIVSFIPAIGAASVVVAVAGLLLLTGHTQAALYLALWGVVVVGLIDNLMKPWLAKGDMEIHGGLIFFALIGGIATFGPVGLIAGPLILSFFLAVLRLWGKDSGTGTGAKEPVPE